MRYITAEQFLQADKKVQDSIMKWWQPEDGDLIQYNCNGFNKILALDIGNIVDMKNGYLGNVIPLFTLQQLIEYVNSLIYAKIEYNYYTNDCDAIYELNIDDSHCSAENSFTFDEDIPLLQAMWKVAQVVGSRE